MVLKRIPSLTVIFMLSFFLTYTYSQKQIVDIHYADFSQNQDSLQLNGEALFRTDDLGNKVVTVVPCSTYSSGSIFYKTPVSLLDPSGNGVSFSAFFRFRMPYAGGAIDADGSGADGVVFVVQTVSNNVGNVGSGMGFENIPKSVGIEFDTYNNGYKDNDNGNHIGIDILGSTNSIKTINMPKRLNDGDIWCAWVDYSGLTQILEVRFDSVNVRPTNPLISDTLNLLNILGSNNAYFGFTAATGAGFADHDIIELRFINEFQPIKKNLINDSVYYVNENEINGFLVGDISKDSLYQFEYLFLQNPVNDFAIDSFTGEITVQSFTGLNYNIKSLYNFNVIAVAFDTLSINLIDTIFDTANITIHINEISKVINFIDNQTFVVKDTASAQSLVGTILTQNSTYDSLIILNNNSEFIVNPNNLEIKVSSSAQLNYDSVSQYTFNIIAKKKYYVDDTAHITINIEDVIFTSNLIDDQTFTVYDNISSGTIIGIIDTIISVDSLIPIGMVQEFNFNSNNFSLSTSNATTLNADITNHYEFKIIATKNSFTNDTATISINVLKFIKSEDIISDQSFTVKEDILPGSTIGTVNFKISPDTLIVLNNFPEFSYIENQSNFILNNGKKLNYETTNKYIYTVVAKKHGYLNDTATITINVLEVKIPPITYSGYYDVDANGKIDSIIIEFEDPFNYPDQVYYNLSWLDRNYNPVILSGNIIGNKLYIAIKESDEINTSGKMLLSIKDSSNGDSVQINVNDRAAPVLRRAIYRNVKDKKSTLKTIFSEEIDAYNTNSPFNFYRNSDSNSTQYEILISNTKSDKNDSSWCSDIDTITVVEYVLYKDSLNIDINSQIIDKHGNYQNNQLNRLVELEIAESEFDIDVTLITPFNPLETVIPDKFKEIFDKPVSKGTIINIDFNSQIPLYESDLACSIYDVVGNIVLSCGGVDSITQDLKVARIEDGRELIIYWGGRNDSRRVVGSGTYLIVLDIKPKKGIVISKKVYVGVNR